MDKLVHLSLSYIEMRLPDILSKGDKNINYLFIDFILEAELRRNVLNTSYLNM